MEKVGGVRGRGVQQFLEVRMLRGKGDSRFTPGRVINTHIFSIQAFPSACTVPLNSYETNIHRAIEILTNLA